MMKYSLRLGNLQIRFFSKSYYEILNLNKSATGSEVKKAFFELAKKYHPDTNKDPDAPKKFIEAKKAYEILSDSEKRKLYDSGVDQENLNSTYNHDFQSKDIFTDFYKNFNNLDFFSELFQEHQSKDIELVLEIDFITAARGGSHTFSLSRDVPCSSCVGKGHKSNSKTTCFSCKGTGHNTEIKGGFIFTSTCRFCKGNGFSFKDICNVCEGSGRKIEPENIQIEIPSGILISDFRS
jgi:DnaJ-class molecular chaperone